MTAVLVLQGPNLNLVGTREPEIYGRESLEEIHAGIAGHAAELGLAIAFFQSNHEGALIDRLHQRDFDVAIVNATRPLVEPDCLREIALCAVNVSQPEQRVDAIRVHGQRLFEQADGFNCAFRHEGMGAFTMERIDLFLAPQQPCVAPVADDMSGLPHAHGQGHEQGPDGHGKDDECDRAQIKLDGGAGPNCNRSGIQLAEIAVKEDPGADEEDGGEQSEHRSRPLFSWVPFSASGAVR